MSFNKFHVTLKKKNIINDMSNAYIYNMFRQGLTTIHMSTDTYVKSHEFLFRVPFIQTIVDSINGQGVSKTAQKMRARAGVRSCLLLALQKSTQR